MIVFGYAGLWVPPDGLPDRTEIHVRVDLSSGRDRGRGDRTGGQSVRLPGVCQSRSTVS